MRLIIFITLLALLIPSALAVGLAPAESTIDYQGGAVTTGQIKVFGEGEIVLTSSDPRLVLDRNVVNGETIVRYTVRMEGFDPGETELVIRASSAAGSGMVNSVARVAAKVIVSRAYEGSYVTFDVVAPQPGGDAFYVKVENKGTTTISELRSYVDIRSNDLAERFSSEQTSLDPGEEAFVKIPVSIDAGAYDYELTVLADGDVKRRSGEFSYGAPDLVYRDFLVQDFVLGGLNEFIITLENRFNRPVSADVTVDLIQNDETIDAFSQETTIDQHAEKAISAYLNTNRAVLGEATLSIEVAYDGIARTYEELVTLEDDAVRLAGRVTGGERSNVNVIFFFVVIAVIVNSILIYLLFRRRK